MFDKYLHPVEYVDVWPDLKTKRGGAHASIALIKSKATWGTELEWRFIMSNKDLEQTFIKRSIDGLKISSIYLGLDFFLDKERKNEQIDFLKACSNVEVKIIRTHNDESKMGEKIMDGDEIRGLIGNHNYNTKFNLNWCSERDSP